jgi:hypothetical protein
VRDRIGAISSRLFDGAASIGYLIFGVPMVILAVFAASSLHPFGLLLAGILGLTGGGAIRAAVQTWRREPGLGGSVLMLLGIVACTTLMVWAFINGFGP